eukprot:1711978-Alexandrium_andersonii.AAC.1
MSASLVGSEMCIRDRPSTRAPASPGLKPREDTSRMHVLGWSSSALQTTGCLLYTSDAADDM